MNTRKKTIGTTAIIAVAASLAATPAVAYENATPADYVEISRMQLPANVDIDHATPIAYLIVDANGKQVTDPVFRVEVADGRRYVVTLIPAPAMSPQQATYLDCNGWNSPIPTYSWSNHTVHYGMYAICTGEPVLVRARGSLWSGPDYDQTNTLQASLPGKGDWQYGAGNTVSIDRVSACVDWGDFDWWELVMYFEVSRPWGWAQFLPYPLKVRSEIQCLDIV